MTAVDNLWHYRATMVRVVDGDTLDAELQLGFYCSTVQRLRLLGSSMGINCPEMHDPDPAKRALAADAKRVVEALLPPGAAFMVVTSRPGPNDPKDGFGRFLAQVILPGGANLGDHLLQVGLAVPYVRAA